LIGGGAAEGRRDYGRRMTSARKAILTIAILWVLVIVGVAVATRHLYVLAFLGLLAVLLFPLRRR